MEEVEVKKIIPIKFTRSDSPKAFATAILSKIEITGMAIKLDPSSDNMPSKETVVPLTSVWKGGSRKGGRPEATWPVIWNGIFPVVC